MVNKGYRGLRDPYKSQVQYLGCNVYMDYMQYKQTTLAVLAFSPLDVARDFKKPSTAGVKEPVRDQEYTTHRSSKRNPLNNVCLKAASNWKSEWVDSNEGKGPLEWATCSKKRIW